MKRNHGTAVRVGGASLVVGALAGGLAVLAVLLALAVPAAGAAPGDAPRDTPRDAPVLDIAHRGASAVATPRYLTTPTS